MTSASSYFDRDYTANLDEVSASLRVLTDDHRAAFLRWTFLFNLSLGLSDIAVMAVATITIASAHSYSLLFIDRDGHTGLITLPVLIALFALAWVASLWLSGCYRRHLMGEGYDLYARVLESGIACALIAGAAVFFARVQLPRTQVLLTILLACALTGVERWLWRRVLHFFRMRGRMGYPVTLVGTWGGYPRH